MTITDLPIVNATLNGIATLLLLAGRVAIKSGKKALHKKLMVSALGVSAIFLTCYLYYHHAVGHVPYEGVGLARAIYFFILITHIPLAMCIVPASLTAVWFARQQNFVTHTRITRILWPIWIYVSVTGVIIYLMLYVI